MPTATQNMIEVPKLIVKRKEIIPAFGLGREIKNYGKEAVNIYKDAPTLAELRHAFFGGSEDYRKSVLSKRGYAEWTSTFLRDGKEAVERPEKVSFENGEWIAEGGKVTVLELPPNGWTLEYDKPTGFPSNTSKKRKDAEKVFGDDASYFYHTDDDLRDDDLRAVVRDFGVGGAGPFSVDAGCEPASRGVFRGSLFSSVGSRSCRRSEQDAERLATPVYRLVDKTYREILEFLDSVKGGELSLKDLSGNARELHRNLSRLKPIE